MERASDLVALDDALSSSLRLGTNAKGRIVELRSFSVGSVSEGRLLQRSS